MITVALIGFGYWGPNIFRNFLQSRNCRVKIVCDVDTKKLNYLKHVNPTVITTNNLEDIIQDKKIKAVAIATPPNTHFSIAQKVLLAGKDVFVEKPMTINSKEGAELVRLARTKNKIIMVDHTFLYHPAVKEIVKIVTKGTLGRIISISSTRANLGLYQRDVNVIEDLASHDFSIVDAVLGRLPQKVMAVGSKNFDTVQEDQAYIHLWYPNNVTLNVNISWLSPIKKRQMIICGTKKMLVYDDLEVSEKIKIYDTGVKIERDPMEVLKMKVGYRQGNIFSPNIETTEALTGAVANFLTSAKTRSEPFSDAECGLRVVKIVEAAQFSLRNNSKVVNL